MDFTLTSPEKEGLSPLSIANLIEELHNLEIPMHSLLIVKNDRLVAENYYKPYSQDKLHRMFSVSKSLTSIAIGFLYSEGKLSLSDPIYTYFPDKLPKDVPLHPSIEKMTIRNLLTMSSCHSATTYKVNPKKDWVASFFMVEPDHEPGTTFNYDTSASHVLGALVEKLSHMKLLDYLRSKCPQGIKISSQAYFLEDPFGSPLAGSGLMAKTRDLLSLGHLVMKPEVYPELSPKFIQYIEDAKSYQVDTSMKGQTLDERQGYGYQIWRIRDNGFAFYGMGGQLMMAFPDYDLMVATTADTMAIKGGHQIIYDAVMRHLLSTASKIRPVSLPILDSKYLNRIYKVENARENPHSIEEICLELDQEKKEGQLQFTLKGKSYHLPFGLETTIESIFPVYNQYCQTKGTATNNHSLYIQSSITDESIGSVHFHLYYEGKSLHLHMQKYEEDLFNEFTGHLKAYFTGTYSK